MDRTDHERLAVIEEVVLRLEERLFGDGQPGEIATLKARVHRIEQWFWRISGGGAVLLALGEKLLHR